MLSGILLWLCLSLGQNVAGRRNSKFAKDWAYMDKVNSNTNLRQDTVKRVRLKNSPIHYISLNQLPSILSRASPGLGQSLGQSSLQQSLGQNSQFSALSQIANTISNLKLAPPELPKKGQGVRIKNDPSLHDSPSKKTVSKNRRKNPHRKKGSWRKNSKIVKPKVPFVVNGKPHSPYTLKNKLNKDKKKQDAIANKVSIKTDEQSSTDLNNSWKPSEVYSPNKIIPDALPQSLGKNKTNSSRLKESSKNDNSSKSGQKSGSSTGKVKLKSQNSPIFTYKLPPNLSFNSLRSILGSIKGAHSNKILTRPKTTTATTTTTTTPSTTTSTTTTTTTTTTEVPSTTSKSSINDVKVSQVFTYKMPPFFSASAFKKFLVGYGHAKHNGKLNNPFSLKKFIKGYSSKKTSTTPATTTTSTTTSTTTAAPAKTASLRSKESPITWIAGKLTGIPSKIFNFKVPFSLLSWIDNLGSSHHKSEPITRG